VLKPVLTVPEFSAFLKLKYDILLSSFDFNFNLRPYSVVELLSAAAAATALSLDARAPGGGALEIRPCPDAPRMREPPGNVTSALDNAIAAGALSADDVDDDAWEALHLVGRCMFQMCLKAVLKPCRSRVDSA